jgi:Cse1
MYNRLIQAYSQDKVANWKSKDTAFYLITSLSAKAVTAQAGATQTNEYVPVLPVFGAHVIPDLSLAVDGEIHPIIKVDAIKYLMVFRGQVAPSNAAQQVTVTRSVPETCRAPQIVKLRRLHVDCALH